MKKEMHCIMKKLLSILLSLVLLSSLCAAFAEEDVIDVSIVVYQRSNQGNADNIWWWIIAANSSASISPHRNPGHLRQRL